MKITKVIEKLSEFDPMLDVDQVIVSGDLVEVNAINVSSYIRCSNGLMIYELKDEDQGELDD